MTQMKRCPIFKFGSWWAHPQQIDERSDRVVRSPSGSGNSVTKRAIRPDFACGESNLVLNPARARVHEVLRFG